MVLCKDCNHELDEPTNITTENRRPCPCCGSMLRLFTVQTGGNIAPSGRLVGRKLSTDGTEAIRVSDSQKRSSATDLDTSGQLSYSIEGVSPRGESDTLDVCRTLIQRLNMSGGQWGAPTVPDGPEGGIDCVANDGQQALYIQVTRAVSKQDIWRQLGAWAVPRPLQQCNVLRMISSGVYRRKPKRYLMPNDRICSSPLMLWTPQAMH